MSLFEDKIRFKCLPLNLQSRTIKVIQILVLFCVVQFNDYGKNFINCKKYK
jgi:hypothetical protein